MKDFFGQPIAVGDLIMFARPKHRMLTMGYIASITHRENKEPVARIAYFDKTIQPNYKGLVSDWTGRIPQTYKGNAIVKAPDNEYLTKFLLKV